MVSAREASYAIYGAWRLAHFDAGGLQYFENSVEALWRSFWAAAIALPGYALIVLMRVADSPIAVSPLKLALVEGIAYVAGWAAFPLAMYYAALRFGRLAQYCRYIVAYNWSVIVQITLVLAVTAIAGSLSLSRPAGALMSLAATVAILAWQWFIARVALSATVGGAFAVVALDLAIALAINGWADRLLLAGAVQPG